MARRGLGAEQIVSKLRQIEVLMAQEAPYFERKLPASSRSVSDISSRLRRGG